MENKQKGNQSSSPPIRMFAVVSVGNEPFLTTGLITRPALLQPEEGMSVATGRVVDYRVSIDGDGGRGIYLSLSRAREGDIQSSWPYTRMFIFSPLAVIKVTKVSNNIMSPNGHRRQISDGSSGTVC